ncbi:restriction endonuclease subunit S [Enterococcus sp. AZ154]|uniref:restriction endonuclease subunit S n=1 Tax=Enterococcus sp. AZ154 TaxID=2774683 RepID=UPI003D2D9342
MSENEKLVPKRRFKAFENDVAWEQRELGEVVNLENGYAFKSDYFVEEETGIEVLTPGNVNIGGGFQADKGRNYSVKGPAPEKFVFKPNDVFVTMTDLTPSAQTLGYPALVPDDGKTYLHNQRLGKLTNFKVSSDFLIYLLCTDTYHNEIISSASGTTVKHSSPSKILKYSFMMPEYKEQELIGKFFRNLDQTIAFQQRKLEKVKSMKSAYLSEMFPAEGERKPKRRFPGFTDDWEQRELSKLAMMNARIGWQNLRTSEFLDEGDYMLITGTDFEDGRINFSTCHFVEKERYEQDKNIQISNGSILITKDGTLGKVAYVENLAMPATLNAGVFNVRIKNSSEVDEKYLFQYLKAPFLMNYVNKRATGGTIKHLNQNILVDFPVLMPKKEEQKKIGTFFHDLDQTIAFQQQKLEKLQNIKKAYLNEMFIRKGA